MRTLTIYARVNNMEQYITKQMLHMYTMGFRCYILCCYNMTSLSTHLFHDSTVRVINSRVSGQCEYTLRIRIFTSSDNSHSDYGLNFN